MTRWWLRVAVTVTLMIAVIISVVHALAASSSTETLAAVRATILPSHDCGAETDYTVCWGGIAIGVTTREDALEQLAAHPWIGAVTAKRSSIAWDWNGTQPDWIDGSEQGLISLRNDRVVQVRLQTRFPYGTIWLALGVPDHALLVRPVSRSTAYQIFSYDEDYLQVISAMGCPASPNPLWNSLTILGFGGSWTNDTFSGIANDIYALPGWWAYLHPCQVPPYDLIER